MSSYWEVYAYTSQGSYGSGDGCTSSEGMRASRSTGLKKPTCTVEMQPKIVCLCTYLGVF